MKPQIVTSFGRSIPADPQDHIASFSFYSPETGNVMAHHAPFVIAGEIGDDENTRISITVGIPGCRCQRHCSSHGTAFVVTPEPAHARAIAEQLIEMADRFEKQAAIAASAALTKAAQR